ncbi:hypothetical protein [Dietzia sp. SYD-A1]|uniref:hypothetical protein n=1 Tax=Dietzia sp. SYD-A1 TaxID=2780141 RepID=UPI001891654A|nr:hypothetical protein [Dietzia sp. SYD-A1]
MKRLSLGLVGLVVLGGCGAVEEQASAPETVTQTVTKTTTATETAPSTTAEAFDPTAIRSVVVDFGPHGNAVGQRMFQVNRHSGSTALPSVNWESKGEDGDLRGYDCGVIVDISGPGGIDERMRSSECSGSVSNLTEASALGTYNVRVEVSPPNGDDAVVAETDFELIGYGQ